MKISSLKCNHMTNPIGFKMNKPVFQFVTDFEPDTLRLVIGKDSRMSEVLYDSGERTDMDPLGFEADLSLMPRTRYYYQVFGSSKEGDVESGISFFETGKRDEAWQARFITCPETQGEEADRLPLFKKHMAIEKPLETASLYISAVGLYEAFIGGQRVGDEYMTPYCNNYKRWLQVQSYDVTELLEESGDLTIAVGDGWYKGRFGYDPKKTAGYYGDRYSLIAELHLVYEDGSEEVIGTDAEWDVTRAKLKASNIYDGEIFDATLPEIASVKAVVDDTAEETLKPILTDRLSLPVHVMNRLSPVEVIHTPAGETVLDLGQNMTGIFELRVHVPAGKKVFLQFGEILQEGNFFNLNLRSAKAEYTFISDGESHVLYPHFCFYGYRYVKVEGIDDLQPEDFEGLVLHSDLDVIGTMTTGNPLVNQLLSNVIWGQKGNFLDVPTDCPQRDERMGWTGDAEVFAPTASYWMETFAFYNKYLYDMYTEQVDLDGMVPHVIPSFGLHAAACAWADAATIIPWKVYMFYGDAAILRSAYPGMKAWVDYVTKLEEKDHAWEKQFHFGDWLALDHPDPKQIVLGGTPEGFLAEVYYLYSTRLCSKAAGVLGLKEEKEAYAKQAEDILSYIRYNYFTPSGRCSIDTMTAHLMTLTHGLSNNAKLSADGLKRLLDFSHGKLKTGFIGTPTLCPTLTSIGENKRAYDLLFNEEYPGWLYEVKNGATTIWERWNSVLEDRRLSDLTMNSLNHYAYGSIAEWIWSTAAGLQPDETVPGFRLVHYAPQVDLRLGSMKAEYQSASGLWTSEWEMKDEQTVTIRLSVPACCHATIVLPGAAPEVYTAFGAAKQEDGTYMVGAGTYESTYTMNKEEING